MISFKGRHTQKDLLLQCVRWYLAYPLSYRALKEMMNERGFDIDHSTINRSGIKLYNKVHRKRIKIRQCKYLNNIIEQDHRNIKRLTRPMLGFKTFHTAQKTLAGIELMAMIKKGQLKTSERAGLSPAEQFYGLAA